MPFTYTYQNHVDFVKAFIRNVPITSIDSQACDAVSNIMYARYPWRFTLKTMSPVVSLSDGNQDYSGVPSDLYRLVRARIVRTDVTPDEYQELIVKKWIGPELAVPISWPGFRSVCIVDETAAVFRLNAAVNIPSGMTLELHTGYQITPTKIGDVQLAGTCWFPDHWAQVFQAGLKWKFYEYLDDKRAGSVVIQGGHMMYTGQLAVFMALLDNMAGVEDSGEGDEAIVPDDALVDATFGHPHVFGFA